MISVATARSRGGEPFGRQARRLAKSGIASGLERTGIGRLVGAWRGRRGEPLVVGYHRVVQDFRHSVRTSMSPMLTSVRTFERHLDWIGRRYRFVSLDELPLLLETGRASGKPPAAITFDDGYSDVFQNALPVLRRKGIPFAVFVVTDLVGTDRLHIHDELYLLLSEVLSQPRPAREALWRDAVADFTADAETRFRLLLGLQRAEGPFEATRGLLHALKPQAVRTFAQALRNRLELSGRPPDGLQSLNWQMLREMVAQGVVVGSHTRTHALLTSAGTDTLRDEVEGSRRELEQRLGIAVRHFVYPDGRFDSRTVRAVAAAGYQTAYTTCRHRHPDHPLLTIPRKMLWEAACSTPSGAFSPAILSCQANGIFDAADKCRLQHDAHSDPE